MSTVYAVDAHSLAKCTAPTEHRPPGPPLRVPVAAIDLLGGAPAGALWFDFCFNIPRRNQKLSNTHSTVSQSWHTTLATRPLAVISCVMDMRSGSSTGCTVHYSAVFMHKITEP